MVEPIPCHLCGKPALGNVEGAGGAKLPICADHYIALQSVENERQRGLTEALRHSMAMMNQAQEAMDERYGLVRSPKVVIPPPAPAASYTSINLTGSTVGVLNTATVGEITANIGMMAQSDPAKGALGRITGAILQESQLSEEAKSSLLDQISVVASHAAMEPEKRKPAVVAPLLASIGQGANAVAAVAGAWTAVEPILKAHFGLG